MKISYPAQQNPYAIQSSNGTIVDVNGNPLTTAKIPQAHIPLNLFKFFKQ